MITLFQYSRAWGLLNPSPFCMKVEVYLKLNQLEYKTQVVSNPSKAPKGKLPYISDKGKVVCDSSLILQYLNSEYHLNLDDHLTDQQKCHSYVLSKMIEEHLYWTLVYSRWIDEENWSITKQEFFTFLPTLLRKFVPKLIRKSVVKQLYSQGMGRHSKDEIYQMGVEDIIAIEVLLGNSKYFYNERVSTIDIICYAFLTSFLWTPINSPIKNYIEQSHSLTSFCINMREISSL